MAPNWTWYLKISLVIVAVDLLYLSFGQGQPPDSDLQASLETIDLVVNIMLFAYVGYRTGRLTGRATAAAEAGVVVSLLPALVAALIQVVQPDPVTAAVEPLVNRVVASIAFNIALGQFASAYYFIHFLIILPLVSSFEKPLPLPNSISESVLHGEKQEAAPIGAPARAGATAAE